jgi:hypothetical protein
VCVCVCVRACGGGCNLYLGYKKFVLIADEGVCWTKVT